MINSIPTPRHANSAIASYLSSTKYNKDSSAMTACASNSKCTGITEVATGSYQLNTGSVMKASKGKVAFVKGSPVTTAEKKYWTIVSGWALIKSDSA